jgi:hypothetical protein
MKTNTTLMDAMDRYFDIQDGKNYATKSKKISEIPNGLTYQQFYTEFLDAFRNEHPNSSAPKNSLIEMFYDDYLKGLPVPSY